MGCGESGKSCGRYEQKRHGQLQDQLCAGRRESAWFMFSVCYGKGFGFAVCFCVCEEGGCGFKRDACEGRESDAEGSEEVGDG